RILESCLFGREILPVGSDCGEVLVHGRASGPDLLALPVDGSTFGFQPPGPLLQILPLRVELRFEGIEFLSPGVESRFHPLHLRGGRPDGVDQERWRLFGWHSVSPSTERDGIASSHQVIKDWAKKSAVQITDRARGTCKATASRM